MDLLTNSTSRNVTSTQLSLSDFCYRVIVFPVNHKAWGPSSEPLYFTFSRLPSKLTLLSGLPIHTHSDSPLANSYWLYYCMNRGERV